MRRQFQLPEADVVYLDNLRVDWETVIDRGMHWVIIKDHPVPPGYQIKMTDVAIKIETGYPRTGLDMAYFYPGLVRRDGKIIGALCPQIIDGKQYQRWSRHRTALNPWREGIDDLSTHMSMVAHWFEEEFTKRENGITV
ncbi:E2/UBC family protein [Arcticibacter tournemirensis]